MKTKGKNFKAILTLGLLPFVATAAVSAQQWMTDSTPIKADQQFEASVEKSFVSHRMHKIALNRLGSIEGRVANLNPVTRAVEGMANMQVFFIQDGKVVSETTTRQDGSFLADGLTEGAFSFVATGEQGFAAYGVKVVAEGTVGANNVMEAATVSPSLDAVKSILSQELPKRVSDLIAEASDSASDRSIGANRVRLENGTLKGSLNLVQNVSVEGTKITLISDEQVVAEYVVSKDGSFSFSNLESGVYQFIATGSAGFAAISFEAIDAANLTDTDEIAVAVAPVVSDSDYLDVTLAAAQDGMFAGDAMAFGGGGDGFGDRFGFGGGFGGACGACGGGGLLGGGGLGGGGLGLGGGGLFGGGIGGIGLLGGIAAAIAIPVATSGSRDPASPAQ